MKIMETKMEALVTPCRNENDSNVYLMRFLQMKTIIVWWKLIAQVVKMPWVETNKWKNITADDYNGLESVVTGNLRW